MNEFNFERNVSNIVSKTISSEQFTGYINIKDFGAIGDGLTDDSVGFLNAANKAQGSGTPLYLPPGNYLISESCNNITTLIGTPNETTITLAPTFNKTSFNSQFCFTNANFSNNGYDSNTANDVVIKHIKIVTSPNSNRSIFGFANVASLEMFDVSITANKVINGSTGRPYAVDALVDLYASCKNVTIHMCKFNNITYARGVTYPWTEGGGGCIWIRNLLSYAGAGAIDGNSTENIEIYNNIFNHATSDEAIAVYGVVGRTRRVNIHHNKFYGLDIDPSQIVFCNTFISVFPLRHPTLGTNAAVEDIVLSDNYISSRSHFYSVIRFGNSSDTDVICQRLTTKNNIIKSFVSSDGTYGPQAQWVASGSPGSSPRPDLNSLPVRAIQGASNTFTNSSACFQSDGDTLICSGTANFGVSGFDIVNNLTLMGSSYYGVCYCKNVNGGNIESTAACFYNCDRVSNPKVKVNLAASYASVMLIDSASGNYSISGAFGTTSGILASITSSTTSSTIVNIISNFISMSNAAYYAVVNGSSTSKVTSRINHISGSLAGGVSGTVTSSLNTYGTTTD